MPAQLHEAMFYKKTDRGKGVQCGLCYRRCKIPDGKIGFCRIRKNVGGKLYALSYGHAYEPSIDPIEKKPFFHFWPGSHSFSFCTPGCNFSCLHCCNSYLSQGTMDTVPTVEMPPEKIVELAKQYKCPGISYTYTEPTVFFEYAYDTGVLARKQGLYNAFVSNGYMTPEAVKKSEGFLDAERIDLKGDEEHYKKICGNVELDKVLEGIKNVYKTGRHVEIITLVIPGDNDSKETVQWMADFLRGLSNEIPWHFIAFFPCYKMMDTPPTPAATLDKMHDWAVDSGMKYVYTGNLPGKYNNTYCPNCNELLIERIGYGGVKILLHSNKKCPSCGTKIPIVGPI